MFRPGVGPWTLGVGSWTLDLGYWIFGLEIWTLDRASWIWIWALVLGSCKLDPASNGWILGHGKLNFGTWDLGRWSWILELGSWVLGVGRTLVIGSETFDI